MIGKLLNGRYEILEQIGSGGMAVVYKAQCKLLNRFVAVKILRGELKSDSDFVERFNIEAKSAAALSHPNIVSVYDVGEQDGIYYIVMEYVDGVTLKEVIQSHGAFDWKGAADISIQLCSAIEHAHKRNIVHRDIKPHNIMINREGAVKVTDFGIARAVSSTTRVAGGNVIGSVHYFSPEQARGESVDSKSDIYSIGVVLYEMLTSKVPFLGDSPYEVARKHIEEKPTLPSLLNGNVPPAMDGIVMKALNKYPSDRYATAKLMLDAIKTAINNPKNNTAFNEDMENTILIPPVIDSKMLNKSDVEKGNKKSNITSILLAVLTAILIVGGATYVAFSFLSPKTQAEVVPDVTGKLLEDVKQQYKDKKITITEDSTDYSTQYDQGYIISQQPSANSAMKLPLEIKVIVSKGRKPSKLANYVNKDYKIAEQELTDMGAIINTKFEKNTDLPKGVVVRQIPSGGESVKSGDIVTLYISDGPDSNKIKVPKLTGLSEEAAKAKIRELGLEVGEISEGKSTMAKDTVYYQDPASGTEVETGTRVNYSKSSGVSISEQPNTTPNSAVKPTHMPPMTTPKPIITPKPSSGTQETPKPDLYSGL